MLNINSCAGVLSAFVVAIALYVAFFMFTQRLERIMKEEELKTKAEKERKKLKDDWGDF